MEYIFTYPREKFDRGELTSTELIALINKHETELVPQMRKNFNYYMGEHEIKTKNREKSGVNNAPNAQPVSNHAKDIADTASGYFMGSPISWKSRSGESDLGALTDAFDYAECSDTDQENALWLSVVGRAYEYDFQERDKSELKTKSLDPFHTFVVCDQSIEHNKLFGVYYYRKKDDTGKNEDTTTYILVSTETTRYEYEVKGEGQNEVAPVNTDQNLIGYIQIIEYKNNKFCIGDFEQQIGLIDAYNTLMADRVNDKEQFVDALLVIYGSLLGDDEKATDEALGELKKKKLLELDEDARAEYLTSTLDEAGAESLRSALKQDIYTFSHVPNLQDENFAGNSSGVAMEYKLLGLEMLTKIKERWYRKAIRERLRIFIGFLGYKNIKYDEADIESKFSRGLPKNNLEISQMIANLSGKVSNKTLLTQIPFVENPESEEELLRIEQEESIRRQQEIFELAANRPPEGSTDEKEDEEVEDEQ